MDLLKLSAPHGTAWELLISVVVVIAGPVLFERVRIPGLIGLLAGGCVIGPNVLGVVSAGNGVLHQLGEVGLLYLMFVAGLELDFGVFARYKNQAVGFSMLTFSLPLALGIGGGLIVGYGFTAALLLGSLFASYTLVVYPIVRNMGIASNGAVATTVGATVLTDTLALVVLAAVAGSASGDASGIELGSQIVLGMAILAIWCFVILPRIARWFFAGIGSQRTLRYMFILAALLSAGTLAEVVGIEPIVGAFFAGLALNRLVPNESEFMEKIEFFGSALLIPMFLVSVGTVIDPSVLVDPATLGTAAVFVVACVGGKLIAAFLCKPLYKFTTAEVGVVFGLSVAQAAATLAATFVGLQIGLFTTTTVNAVMIVIVVSLVLASMAAQRFGAAIPKPEADSSRIGRSVLAHADDTGDVSIVLGIAARLASIDVGLVRPVFIVADGAPEPSGHYLHEVEQTIGRLGVDAEIDVRHDRSINDGILHASSSVKASLLVVTAATQAWLPALLGATQHELVATSAVPSLLVRAGTAPPTRVVLVLAASQAKRPSSAALIAAQVADRLRISGLELAVVATAALAPTLVTALGKSSTVTPTEPAATTGPTTGPTMTGPTTIETATSLGAGWLAEHLGPGDVVVVPGGRNGALATARTTKLATAKGCSIVVAADRESVSSVDSAAERLGLVTSRVTATD